MKHENNEVLIMSKILILSGDDMSFYKFRKELIVCLCELGYDVTLATRFEKYEKALSNLGCKTISVKSLERRGANPFHDIRLVKEYRHIISDQSPDLIMTYTLKPRVYGNLVCGGIPVINTITGMGAYTLDNGLTALLATLLDRIGLKRTNYVFFQNVESREIYYQKRILKKTIPTTVVPASGVNIDDFSFLEYPKHDSVDFAFVGRIMRDKGVEELFYSAEQLESEIKAGKLSVHLFGFSEEDYDARIKELCERKIIIAHGFVDDIRPYLKEMDCIVLPSYHEGVGNAIQEAASSGRPVITTDIPGCRTVVEDGVTGYLCEARNKQSLLNAMKKFAELPYEERKKMGQNGRRKIENEHDRKLVINKYVEVIKTIVG